MGNYLFRKLVFLSITRFIIVKILQVNEKFGIVSSIPMAIISIIFISYLYLVPIWVLSRFISSDFYIYIGIGVGAVISFPFLSIFWAAAAMANEDWQNLFGLYHLRKRPKHYLRDEIARLVGLKEGSSE
tara:strand:+ start:67 stop:453 length:387 start_codon:yes stop_codon:yes gene_type:complete